MTDQEKKDFIEQVKGKKIRWNVWAKKEYFVPDGAYIDMVFLGIQYSENGTMVPAKWHFFSGFKPNNMKHYWEFYEEDPEKQKKETEPSLVEKQSESIDYFEVEGLAITEDKDLQGETISLNGLDCSAIKEVKKPIYSEPVYPEPKRKYLNIYED